MDLNKKQWEILCTVCKLQIFLLKKWAYLFNVLKNFCKSSKKNEILLPLPINEKGQRQLTEKNKQLLNT